MRKSSDRSHHYRPGTSRNQRSTVTFRQQMTDFARGDLLQELRSQARVSRENVAAEIGVTTKTLYTWEKQNGPIKWDNAKRLAAYYNVDPDHLITRDSDEAAGLPSKVQLERIERKLDALLEFLGATEVVTQEEPAELRVPKVKVPPPVGPQRTSRTPQPARREQS